MDITQLNELTQRTEQYAKSLESQIFKAEEQLQLLEGTISESKQAMAKAVDIAVRSSDRDVAEKAVVHQVENAYQNKQNDKEQERDEAESDLDQLRSQLDEVQKTHGELLKHRQFLTGYQPKVQAWIDSAQQFDN